MHLPESQRIRHDIYVAIAALSTFLALYAFRSEDDSNVSSWQWIIDERNVTRIYFVLLAGIAIAYLASRIVWRQRWTLAILLLLSSGTAALFWNTPNYILDSSRYFAAAKYLELYGIDYFLREWGGEIAAWTDMPLGPFIFGIIFKLFGESRIAIQIFTTILFTLTLLITTRIGKALWDEDTGIIAGALLLGMPILFMQTPLMLVDIPLMFLLTLSIFTCINALQKGTILRIIVAAFVVFLTFFIKYSSWPMLSVLFFVFLAFFYSNGPSRSDVFLRTAWIITLSFLSISIVVLFKFDVFAGQIRLLLDFQAPGLRRWGDSFISIFLYQIHPFITIAALYSAYEAARKKDLKYLIIGWLPFLVIAFQIKRTRYILPVFPMLALMASYGLQQITDREIRRFIVACAVLSSLVISVAAYLPFMETLAPANIKAAAAFLDALEGDEVEAITIIQKGEIANPAILVPLLDMHTKKRIAFNYHPANFPSDQEIALSNLRFTWEYRNPPYYARAAGATHNETALVVIARDLDEPLPPSLKQKTERYERSKTFSHYDERLYYKIAVRIYW